MKIDLKVEPKLTSSQQRTFATIVALRRLTKQNGTITTRSQNNILQRLSDDDLTAVSLALAELES